MVNATVPDPVFDGQTKELLTTPWRSSAAGGRLGRAGRRTGRFRAPPHRCAQGRQEDGSAKSATSCVCRAERRQLAGTRTLPSAPSRRATRSEQRSGGPVGRGRDAFGVFPCAGSCSTSGTPRSARSPTTRRSPTSRRDLGLESGKTYAGLDDLHDGVLILADQDVGSPHQGPPPQRLSRLSVAALSQDGFISSMATPIVKARREGAAHYNLTEYESGALRRTARAGASGTTRLGTSTAVEAREYFRDALWTSPDPASDDAMDLAFNKKRVTTASGGWRPTIASGAARRRRRERDVLTTSASVDYELIHFSNYDLERSIPPPWTASRRPSARSSQLRQAQADLLRSGSRSSRATCPARRLPPWRSVLNGAIVTLAQDYVGANNSTCSNPTTVRRVVQGASDAASPRYIYTELSQITATPPSPRMPVLEGGRRRYGGTATTHPSSQWCSSTVLWNRNRLQHAAFLHPQVVNTRRVPRPGAEPMTPWCWLHGRHAEDPARRAGQSPSGGRTARLRASRSSSRSPSCP
jgi:hypothetical protein